MVHNGDMILVIGGRPVDVYNRPLYSDVFNISQSGLFPLEIIEPVDKHSWGELEPEEEYGEEEEDEVGASKDIAEGLVTPSSISSVASNLETPAHIELRKDRKKEEDEGPKHLYQVLPEVKSPSVDLWNHSMAMILQL
ncbi:hypothetical protein G6F56_008076 [Rhizopus delemar]|uniref:Splicing factor 3B subunit 2 n=1 Tax=Rhizopus stolonifer TaxID=4846 RepID=A0A367KUS9_RHIST|nr:hypothetical protein G6F56_008076 [Rhizopus delemar]RCI05917.1 Splicing factor 3B subunit 2 [Rhizopus stolonifer]